MRVVYPTDGDYDEDRRISNARFDYRPAAIYYPESAADVGSAILDGPTTPGAVRIRSGGHHHEGMCSAGGVRLIDLSCIHAIDYRDNDEYVWIGAGAALQQIYDTLWQDHYPFAGGGCGDVHVGGLTQGGGWGLVSRKYGLTCDSLVGVEFVDAKGHSCTIVEVGVARDRNLLWALRGGGGGNFGVVTKFCFRLLPRQDVYTDFALKWHDADLPGDQLDRFILNYVGSFPSDPDDSLTTFLRASLIHTPGDDRVVIGGKYLGNKMLAQAAVTRLLDGQPKPYDAQYTEYSVMEPITKSAAGLAPGEAERQRARQWTHPEYQPGPPAAVKGAAGTGGGGDLSQTCTGARFRHKISSGFARPKFGLLDINALTSVIRLSDLSTATRRYVSLHCLGGAIDDRRKAENSAFAFRDRQVLLQYQAWWQADAAKLDDECIGWVRNVRDTMASHTDGAFINFPDAEIPLEKYYKDSFKRLRDVKKEWDPDDFFCFGMSIPLP